MTWFIDDGRYPVVPTLERFTGGNAPKPVAFGRKPFTEEERQAMPTGVELQARPGDTGPQHMATGNGVMSYLACSSDAIGTLRHLQNDGWDSVPLTPTLLGGSRELLVGEAYHLLHVYAELDAVDLTHSDLQERLIRGLNEIVHRPSNDQRKIAVRTKEIGELHIWRGVYTVCNHLYFVSDALRNAWCEIGMDPDVFEACTDV